MLLLKTLLGFKKRKRKNGKKRKQSEPNKFKKKIKTSKYYKGKAKGLRSQKDLPEILDFPKINERKNKRKYSKKENSEPKKAKKIFILEVLIKDDIKVKVPVYKDSETKNIIQYKKYMKIMI